MTARGGRYVGLYGPAGLAKGIVEVLNREVNAYLQSAEGRTKLGEAGVQVIGGTPEHLAAVMAKDVQKWKRVVEASGARLAIE